MVSETVMRRIFNTNLGILVTLSHSSLTGKN